MTVVSAAASTVGPRPATRSTTSTAPIREVPVMSEFPAADRSSGGKIAAHARWATAARRAVSEAARDRQMRRFEPEVAPDNRLPPAERARRADHARKAYMQRLALKSAGARRKPPVP